MSFSRSSVFHRSPMRLRLLPSGMATLVRPQAEPIHLTCRGTRLSQQRRLRAVRQSRMRLKSRPIILASSSRRIREVMTPLRCWLVVKGLTLLPRMIKRSLLRTRLTTRTETLLAFGWLRTMRQRRVFGRIIAGMVQRVQPFRQTIQHLHLSTIVRVARFFMRLQRMRRARFRVAQSTARQG